LTQKEKGGGWCKCDRRGQGGDWNFKKTIRGTFKMGKKKKKKVERLVQDKRSRSIRLLNARRG